MPSNKTFTILAYFSILPLFFALFLALYTALDGPAISGYFINFARINSYIYAHSYGALLLALFAGIQIGQNLHSVNKGYWLFNFILLWLAWLSYQSFADAQGIILLLCCWLAALIIDFHAHNQNAIPNWYGNLKIRLNTIVIILLLSLVLINH